ncbi:DUF2798 domain-containing protein [Vibrio mediterranei]|uniref:DUF2798 domain-containing protein n=1 Tax=Vibrio mediterranei TaxID=689 RepID=A0AAN1FLK9_9VIBR|nr:DUF2798 domain-containing protein [Vibrio mediterranei]ASI92852.1 hypothetical protein BSZ05_24115 [Vibrio mediterranei]
MTTQTMTASPVTNDASTPILYKVLVIVSLMTVIGGTLTGVMTYMNVGLGETFYSDWLSSFALAAIVMMPLGMVMMTLLTKLANRLLPSKSTTFRNLIVGISMAVVMESLLAFVTAANNIGFADMTVFTNEWFKGVIAALPVGLTIMVVMSMTVKPKIETFLKS